jgi:imidazole glycerol-phosphate synthase subunit HisH
VTVIIDYNTGNINSIKNILHRIGVSAVISNSKEIISNASKLILPGVGHFDHGMTNLEKLDLIGLLNTKVLNDKVPIIGICLGAQLLTKRSEEGVKNGLGWIDGYTKAFDRSRLSPSLKVPHMGWSDVVTKKESHLTTGLESPRFYFVHSFHIVCEQSSDELFASNHGYDFVAGVEHDNILGVQFHPEKSHKYGMKLLENFIKNY